MTETIYHSHHIIPRHAGGTNDPSNLVRITVAEHAETHKKLWEEHGRLQDKVAWLMLSGKTDEGEIARRELLRSPEIRAKISASHKGKIKSKEHCDNLSKAVLAARGAKISETRRLNKLLKNKI